MVHFISVEQDLHCSNARSAVVPNGDLAWKWKVINIMQQRSLIWR